ncbi:MAG: leucine-rich repeat protein, partial [Longicatena sp.]
MKIQYKSKIKKILLVLVLVTTCFLMKSNGRTFASSNDEIQVSFAELNDQFFTQSTINISAKGVVDNIKILSITLPNATIVDGSFASYETHINGENKFIVRYIETSLESNQSNEIQEFECSYNVTTLKEKEEVAEEIEKKDSSNNNEINAASPLEDPINITYESTYNEDNQNYLISAIVKPKNDAVKINSMELPDGTVVEGDVVGYNTKEEIDLTFKINCEDKISSEEKQIVSTFKFEDKDIKTIKNAKLDANGVPYTPEDWFDFDSNTGTITKIKNVMYWDVNWASNPSSPAENFNNGVINIPPTINGVEVKRIGYRAFANNYDSERLVMDAIIFPDTLTTIDQYGAHGIYLLGDSYLKLPENLSSMSILSFGGLHCKGITFPKNLKFSSIGTEFQGVELDGGNGTLDIPEGITSIGENAFMFSNFKKLIMPTSWVSSGRYMFSRTTIREADFSKCTELTSISEGMFSSSSLINLDLSACKKLTTI